MLATQTPVSLLKGIWKVPWNCPTEVLYVAVMSCSVKPSASIILMIAEPVLAWAVLGYVDRKSTRLNSSHVAISYAVFCLKKKKTFINQTYILILSII